MLVRDATAADAAACAAIYAPYVRDTVISFETEPPDAAELARRIAAAQATHAWLVAVEDVSGDGSVLGYAYGGPFARRAAYRWSCEVSVYVRQATARRGVGRALYGALLPRLEQRGYRTALAGMSEPNPGSAGLHAALGFVPIGTYRRVGWKHGAWHDVTWLQRPLGPADESPREPG